MSQKRQIQATYTRNGAVMLDTIHPETPLGVEDSPFEGGLRGMFRGVHTPPAPLKGGIRWWRALHGKRMSPPAPLKGGIRWWRALHGKRMSPLSHPSGGESRTRATCIALS
jgi:hypothetical protein